MKIAIVTQPLGKNYGGIMQAFALQKVLVRAGYNVTTIDRKQKIKKNSRYYFRILYRFILKAMGKRSSPVDLEKYYDVIFANTASFISKNIKLSSCIETTQGMVSEFEIEKYDAVIVGSDQTWRPMYSPNIYNYFLDFLDDNLNIKKIAYASSFGVDQWEFSESETYSCSRLAKKFDHISVREESGIKLCKEYLKVSAECVIDPTLLLKSKDYLDLIDSEYVDSDIDGVYTYWLDKNDEKEHFANEIAELIGTSIFNRQANFSISETHVSNIDDFVLPCPNDWILGFKKSKFVLTDSFHGMVFSIIFQKPFYVVANKSRGSTRFESLLVKLGLNDRLIYSLSDIMNLNIEVDIDYSEVNKRLDNLRERSFDYLFSSLVGK